MMYIVFILPKFDKYISFGISLLLCLAPCCVSSYAPFTLLWIFLHSLRLHPYKIVGELSHYSKLIQAIHIVGFSEVYYLNYGVICSFYCVCQGASSENWESRYPAFCFLFVYIHDGEDIFNKFFLVRVIS